MWIWIQANPWEWTQPDTWSTGASELIKTSALFRVFPITGSTVAATGTVSKVIWVIFDPAAAITVFLVAAVAAVVVVVADVIPVDAATVVAQELYREYWRGIESIQTEKLLSTEASLFQIKQR